MPVDAMHSRYSHRISANIPSGPLWVMSAVRKVGRSLPVCPHEPTTRDAAQTPHSGRRDIVPLPNARAFDVASRYGWYRKGR